MSIKILTISPITNFPLTEASKFTHNAKTATKPRQPSTARSLSNNYHANKGAAAMAPRTDTLYCTPVDLKTIDLTGIHVAQRNKIKQVANKLTATGYERITTPGQGALCALFAAAGGIVHTEEASDCPIYKNARLVIKTNYLIDIFRSDAFYNFVKTHESYHSVTGIWSLESEDFLNLTQMRILFDYLMNKGDFPYRLGILLFRKESGVERLKGAEWVNGDNDDDHLKTIYLANIDDQHWAYYGGLVEESDIRDLTEDDLRLSTVLNDVQGKHKQMMDLYQEHPSECTCEAAKRARGWRQDQLGLSDASPPANQSSQSIGSTSGTGNKPESGKQDGEGKPESSKQDDEATKCSAPADDDEPTPEQIKDMSDDEFTLYQYRKRYQIRNLADLKAHHKHVYDPTTVKDESIDEDLRGNLTTESQIAKLAPIFDDARDRNAVIKAMVSMKPSTKFGLEEAPAIVTLPDGNKLGAGIRKSDPRSYQVRVTFITLYYAPAMRIIIRFQDNDCEGNDSFHKLILDFPFNPNTADGRGMSIQDWKCQTILPKSSDGDVKQIFTCTFGKAFTQGFNLDSELEKRLKGGEGQTDFTEIVTAARALIHPNEPQPLTIVSHPKTPQDGVDVKGKDRQAKYPISPVYWALLDGLPGGADLDTFVYTFPSLACKWESMAFLNNYGDAQTQANQLDSRHTQHAAVDPPHPLIKCAVGDTFRTKRDAGVQLGTYAHYSHKEQDVAREMFSAGSHHGVLFSLDKQLIVLAVKFGKYQKLDPRSSREKAKDLTREEEMEFSLRENEEVVCSWNIAQGPKAGPYTFSGFVLAVPLTDLIRADAYIIVESKTAAYFRGQVTSAVKAQNEGFVTSSGYVPRLKIELKPGNSQYLKDMQTVEELIGDDNTRWHGILLNQLHSDFEKVDIVTAHLDRNSSNFAEESKRLGEAYQHKRTQGKIVWNEEQNQAWDAVRSAPGGFMIGTGPAGTGKSEFSLAQCDFFLSEGIHALILAPTNAATDRAALSLKEKKPDLDFVRVYPSEREYKAHHGFAAAPVPELQNEDKDDISGALTFAIIVNAKANKTRLNANARHLSVQARVIEEAEKPYGERLVLKMRFKPEGSANRDGPYEDQWSHLNRMIHSIKEGSFDWTSDELKHRYRQALDNCKAHIVARTKLAVTTTGNCRDSQLVKYFAESQAKLAAETFDNADLGIPECKGIVIFIDEAPKDSEINCWSPIVNLRYNKKVSGVLLFGDEKQLKPVNISNAAFNEFVDRGNISLVTRLIHQNFPAVMFRVQNRMPRIIGHFANIRVYGGKLLNSPLMEEITLDQQYPGLFDALKTIYKDSSATEDQVRVRWVELLGKRRVNPYSKSKVVLECAQYFMTNIWPVLHTLFGADTSKNVLVICGYSETKYWWDDVVMKTHARISKEDSAAQLTSDHFPRVFSGDSSQGMEAPVVILDGALQGGQSGEVGHMAEEERITTYITRAQAALMILGGTMEGYNGRGTIKKSHPSIAALHEHLAQNRAVVPKSQCGYQPFPDSANYKPLVAEEDVPKVLTGDNRFTGFETLIEEATDLNAMFEDEMTDYEKTHGKIEDYSTVDKKTLPKRVIKQINVNPAKNDGDAATSSAAPAVASSDQPAWDNSTTAAPDSSFTENSPPPNTSGDAGWGIVSSAAPAEAPSGKSDWDDSPTPAKDFDAPEQSPPPAATITNSGDGGSGVPSSAAPAVASSGKPSWDNSPDLVKNPKTSGHSITEAPFKKTLQKGKASNKSMKYSDAGTTLKEIEEDMAGDPDDEDYVPTSNLSPETKAWIASNNALSEEEFLAGGSGEFEATNDAESEYKTEEFVDAENGEDGGEQEAEE